MFRSWSLCFCLAMVPCLSTQVALLAQDATSIRAGIVGLDTSHAIAFTTILNQGPKKPEDAAKVAGVRVVAAYPQGSRDIVSSTQRVPEYTKKIRELGVEVVASIDELLQRVDVVLLESNDGRVHYEQLQPILAAGKPVFIDKPVAGDLVDAVRIFDAVKAAGVPCFTASSLRFGKTTQAVRGGSIGKVSRAETFSPASLEPTHTDLYWYGIHGCEALHAVMGMGCQTVQRTKTADGKFEVIGRWPEGRVGIFRESNQTDRKGFGGIAVGEKGEAPIGLHDGYEVLLVEIVKMFRDGVVPVRPEETLELFAFMEAADESQRRGGSEVSVQEVLTQARAKATERR